MVATDWKNDFGPFETNTDKYHFWRFVLKKVEHLDDQKTADALHLAFVDWRRRQEDTIGALKEIERQARQAEMIEAKKGISVAN